jgi:hypothetical protein
VPLRDFLARMRHDGCGGLTGKAELLTGIEGASGLVVAPFQSSCLVLKHHRLAGGQNLALAAALRLHMSDRQPQIETATKARQGETTGVVRWVLGISLTLAIIAMVVAFLVF